MSCRPLLAVHVPRGLPHTASNMYAQPCHSHATWSACMQWNLRITTVNMWHALVILMHWGAHNLSHHLQRLLGLRSHAHKAEGC
jgi:hypothetical protein